MENVIGMWYHIDLLTPYLELNPPPSHRKHYQTTGLPDKTQPTYNLQHRGAEENVRFVLMADTQWEGERKMGSHLHRVASHKMTIWKTILSVVHFMWIPPRKR